MKLLILIFLFTPRAFCPMEQVLYMEQPEPIQPFKPLIYAVGKVECDFDTLAYNPIEKAAGYFQIRPIRVEHYNRLTGEHLTLQDMYDYYKAEKVFLYYASKIGPYDFEKIAKRWNGSGKMTIDYWKRVQKQLNKY